jgi:hypothetical protein
MAAVAEQILPVLDNWIQTLNTMIPQPQPFNQIWGWTLPSISRADLVAEIEVGKARVSNFANLQNESDTVNALAETPARLAYISANVLPNVASANAIHVVPAIRDELDRLLRLLPVPPVPPPPPLPDWEKLADSDQLPKKLTVRLRALEARLSSVEPRTAELDNKIATIDNAYESAQRLPTDLATLAEGQREIETSRTQVQSYASEANTSNKEASRLLDEVRKLSNEANTLFKNLEKVYRAAATEGLAKAFAVRANWMNVSVAVWVLLLICDLGLGAYVGAQRFAVLETLLQKNLPSSVFWGNLLFALVSVAAPVWFGWVATKQISQRFKLAEDYSFKASVASAYEGYRSEAVRLDPAFEKRLFGSALDRLEEAPLRFLDQENFGTPWHELTSSPAFAKALEAVPDLRSTVAQIIASVSGGASSAAAALKALGSKPNEVGTGPAAE